MNLKTIAREAEIEGVGLHTGSRVRLRIVPRDVCGLVLVRTDLLDAPEIPVSLSNVAGTKHATTLTAAGASVSTTEHLLAALWTSGITNARIELDGPEIPILDGSAAPWVALLRASGARELKQPRPVYDLRHPVWIEEAGSSVMGLPCEHLRVSVAVRYNRDWLEPQCFDGVLSTESFASELAAARTFTLEEWIEPLRAEKLIQGGSAENAVVLHADAPSSPFRMEQEMARHKALDLVGDMALLFGCNGGLLRAHLIAIRGGHGPHRMWMEAALKSGALARDDGGETPRSV